MSTNRELITISGFENLKAELHHLKNVEKPQVIAAVAEGRSHGDLKENAEYESAREKHSYLEGRIQYLENLLNIVEVIDPKKVLEKDVVSVGAKVTINDLDNDQKRTVSVVGSYEADIAKDLISNKSPLGKCLINKKVGDIASFEAPAGLKEYEIIKINY
jgi:transcription elongation factor GreA